jgi:PST family polysaccharide transporter
MEMDEIESPLAATAQPLEELSERPGALSRGKSILLNFGSLSAGTAVTRLTNLATNAVLARRVSISGYGITGIAQSITIYFGLLSELGLGTVAIREGAQHPEKLQQVISSMMGLRLVLASAAVLLGLMVSPYLPFSETSRSLFRLYILTLPIEAISVDWVFRAVQRMHWNTILQAVGAALTLSLTILLVQEPRHLLRLGGIAAVAALAPALLGIVILGRQGFHARPTFSIADAKYFLAQSLPLCATWLAILLYSQANILILGAARGESDVGLYGAAIRMSQLFYQPIWIYFAAIVPALMQSWAQSQEKARLLLSDSVRLTAITTIGAGIVSASAGTWLLARIFGKSFGGAGQAFEIMIWTQAISAIGQNWSNLCVAAKRNGSLIRSNSLGAIVNVMVCLATVSRMGIRGAALSNLLAATSVTCFLICSFGRDMGFNILQGAARPALAGAGAYLVSLATRWTAPPVCATLSVFSFVILLLLTGAVTAVDLKRLRVLIMPARQLASEVQP